MEPGLWIVSEGLFKAAECSAGSSDTGSSHSPPPSPYCLRIVTKQAGMSRERDREGFFFSPSVAAE